VIDEVAIDHIVRRLARPAPTGGHVIERAAVLAEGPNFAVIEAWILEHGGEPEVPRDDSSGGMGAHLFSGRSSRIRDEVVPVRYLLPPDALPAAEAH
jgi:hypothetical protein